MKKTIAMLAVLLCAVMLVFAGFEYRLDLFSFDPIHDTYMADRNSANLQFNYIYQYKDFPDHVYQSKDTDPETQ